MVEGLIGKKVGMTQVFQADGSVDPVTVIAVGPCVVVQLKTKERDGYEAVQVGLVDAKAAKNATRPMKGHHEKAGVPPTRVLHEFPLSAAAAEGDDPAIKPGDALSLDIFEGVETVDIAGVAKGKGFQGVIRRHGFGGGRATDGSMFHRAPGSIGQSAYPSKVMKGMRGPGHTGSRRITTKNAKIIRIDSEKGLLMVRGAVPGSKGSTLWISKAKSAPAGNRG
jgi:large subunit ribosomal protein L3